jgi:hypothetical protein
MISDISDHFFNFICVPAASRTKQTTNNFKYLRPFTLTNMTNFRDDLKNINWHPVLSSNNVDTGFGNFWEIFSTLYDLHFPLTKVKFNRNIHRINDFMTKGLLVSRKRKLELQKLSILDPASYFNTFKQYRNLFNSTLRASKNLYYDTKFSLYAKNPKKNLGNPK